MSNLEVFLSIVALIIVFGGVFLFYYLLSKLRDLESQVRYNKSTAEDNYYSHWRRIANIGDKHQALEKYLGIEYVKRSKSCYTKTKGK